MRYRTLGTVFIQGKICTSKGLGSRTAGEVEAEEGGKRLGGGGRPRGIAGGRVSADVDLGPRAAVAGVDRTIVARWAGRGERVDGIHTERHLVDVGPRGHNGMPRTIVNACCSSHIKGAQGATSGDIKVQHLRQIVRPM